MISRMKGMATSGCQSSARATDYIVFNSSRFFQGLDLRFKFLDGSAKGWTIAPSESPAHTRKPIARFNDSDVSRAAAAKLI